MVTVIVKINSKPATESFSDRSCICCHASIAFIVNVINRVNSTLEKFPVNEVYVYYVLRLMILVLFLDLF